MTEQVTGQDADRAQNEDIMRRLFELVERTHAHAERALVELELGKTEAHVLRVLEPGQPLVTRELAARMHKDPSNLTAVLVRLERRELIERRVAPHDRRARLLALTSAGEHIRETLLSRLLEDPPAVSGLSAEQRVAFHELLRKLD